MSFLPNSPHWHDTGGWNPSSRRTRTYLFYIDNIMGADLNFPCCLSPIRCQAMTWINADSFSIQMQETIWSEIWNKMHKSFCQENPFPSDVCKTSVIPFQSSVLAIVMLSSIWQGDAGLLGLTHFLGINNNHSQYFACICYNDTLSRVTFSLQTSIYTKILYFYHLYKHHILILVSVMAYYMMAQSHYLN